MSWPSLAKRHAGQVYRRGQEAIQAEANSAKALAGEDPEAALTAKRTLGDIQTKVEYWTNRVKALDDLRSEAEQTSREREVALLREAGRKLVAEVEAAAEAELPKLGAALAELMSVILLRYEVPLHTRGWA
jgi:hypothetical protein